MPKQTVHTRKSKSFLARLFNTSCLCYELSAGVLLRPQMLLTTLGFTVMLTPASGNSHKLSNFLRKPAITSAAAVNPPDGESVSTHWLHNRKSTCDSDLRYSASRFGAAHTCPVFMVFQRIGPSNHRGVPSGLGGLLALRLSQQS